METLHKIAGVQDAEIVYRANNENQAPQAVDNSSRRGDLGEYNNNTTYTPARAPFPLNHKSSRPSVHTNRDTENGGLTPTTPRVGVSSSFPSPRQTRPQQSHPSTQQTPETHLRQPDEPNSAEDEVQFAWGPTHPCFPHPNPHCVPDSDEARATRVIRVRRDWMATGDQYPQFMNLYPEILDPVVSDEEFRKMISTLNGLLHPALDPMTWQAWIDAILGVATGFLWDDLGLTGAKRKIKDVDAFIDRWNAERARAGKEVRLMPLRRTGFMTLDFVISDPGIDEERREEENDGER